MMRRHLVGLGLAVSLAACTTPAYEDAIFAKAKSLQAVPEYRIGEGDSITIRVLGTEDPDLLVEAAVRPDGMVSFPRHGDIEAAGKTPEELRGELEIVFQKTLGYTEKPTVYVAARTFPSKFVTVLGQVIRPGRFPYTGQMRVADLLGLSVGPNLITASRNKALLFREVDGAMKVYHVHLKDFYDDANFDTNFYVRPGDVLFVPRNGLAKAHDGIRKVLLPVSALFGAVGLGGRAVTVFTGGAGA